MIHLKLYYHHIHCSETESGWLTGILRQDTEGRSRRWADTTFRELWDDMGSTFDDGSYDEAVPQLLLRHVCW